METPAVRIDITKYVSDCCRAPVSAEYDEEYNKFFYDCVRCGSACNIEHK